MANNTSCTQGSPPIGGNWVKRDGRETSSDVQNKTIKYFCHKLENCLSCDDQMVKIEYYDTIQ